MKNSSLHAATLTATLLAAVGLAVELTLSHHGKSLCHASACEIVGRYIRFGEPTLLAIGAGIFFLLAGFIFFAGRYGDRPLVRALPLLTLIGAAAFDGALLGFQFITLRQHCQLCITVALVLATIALLYSASLRKWLIFSAVCVVWGAGFIANAILVMPDATAAHSSMIFYERAAAKEFPSASTAVLVFSMECPHCQEVLASLAQKNPKNIHWKFAVVDQSIDSINKLMYFSEHSAQSANPFQLLLDVKQRPVSQTGVVSNAKIPELTRQARLFLANNGLNAIPVLVFIESKERMTFRIGLAEILTFIDSLD